MLHSGTAMSKLDDALIVSPDFIASSLSHYKEDFVFLQSATFSCKTMSGSFCIQEYPLTKPGYLPYVTTPLLFLMLSQLGYVLTRLFCEGTIGSESDNRTGALDFFRARDSGKILITDIERVKFSSKISLLEPIAVDISVTNTLQSAGLLFVKLDFELARAAASGRFTCMVDDR
jgi:hypothetical protein